MVKESSRDSSLKKKRKSSSALDNETDGDIYKKAVEFEEKEALSRPSEVDAQLYFDICKEIRKLLADIGELKLKNSTEAKVKIGEKALEINMKLVVLKKLNRMEKVRLVAPKEQLTAEKQKVDSINLQYQNLLYEANHLISEHRKCFQFKSKDESIELVPIEEFLKGAPEALTTKFRNIDDKDENLQHELRLARLEWELKQRIDLANMCKDLEEEKKKLEADIAERKSKLEQLGPLLAAVMESTKPVQEHLELHIDKIQAEHKLAGLLPSPLYIFYANIDAYRQVNDRSMSVVIIGDQDEATQFNQGGPGNALDEDEDDSEPEPEIESQENEEIVEIKKRRHRKSIQIDPMEEKKKKLFQVHPLRVEVTVQTKDGPSIRIKFHFYTKLELITVTSTVEIPNNITGNAAREVLSNESILMELLEGDLGLDSPNPCTQYQLKKVGLTTFRSFVPDLGYVYGWAQKVCGFDFLAKSPGKRRSDRLSQTSVELVMKTVKNRLKYRYVLAQQLEDLERNMIPVMPKKLDLPKSTISTLTRWTSTTYQNFCQAKYTELLIENEVVSPNDIFYSAIVTRNNANLTALVAIKNDYPTNPPVFALCLNYNNGQRHSLNDDNIRDLERSINIDFDQCQSNNASWLLSAQILSLCVGLDIYLETEDPKTFPQNTMYIKSSCARNRRKPFKFRNVGVGVFTQ